MFSVPVNHLLEVFEHYLALSGPRASELMLHFSESSFAIGLDQAPASFRNLKHPDRFDQPLTEWEERRLNTLDRKAKGGLLSEQEYIEFEALLEIKRYYEEKHLHPDLSHQELLAQARA